MSLDLIEDAEAIFGDVKTNPEYQANLGLEECSGCYELFPIAEEHRCTCGVFCSRECQLADSGHEGSPCEAERGLDL